MPQAPSTTKPSQPSKPRPPATGGSSGSKPATQKPTSPSSGGSSGSGNKQLTQKQKVTLTKESPIFWLADKYKLFNIQKEHVIKTFYRDIRGYFNFKATIAIGYNVNKLGLITLSKNNISIDAFNVGASLSGGKLSFSVSTQIGNYKFMAYVANSLNMVSQGLSILFQSPSTKLYGALTLDISYNRWALMGAKAVVVGAIMAAPYVGSVIASIGPAAAWIIDELAKCFPTFFPGLAYA